MATKVAEKQSVKEMLRLANLQKLADDPVKEKAPELKPKGVLRCATGRCWTPRIGDGPGEITAEDCEAQGGKVKRYTE